MSTKRTEIKITIEQKQRWRISSVDNADSSDGWQTEKPALLNDGGDAEISRCETPVQSRSWKVLSAFVRAINYALYLLERIRSGKR